MKCEECLGQIEELFDGELDEAASIRTRAHLSACDECGAAYEALVAEQQLYARYQRDIEVTPAIWHAIEARLGEETTDAPRLPRPLTLRERLRQRLSTFLDALPRFSPAAATALALLIICFAAALFWQRHAPNGERQLGIARVDLDAAQPASATTADNTSVASNEMKAGDDEVERQDKNAIQPAGELRQKGAGELSAGGSRTEAAGVPPQSIERQRFVAAMEQTPRRFAADVRPMAEGAGERETHRGASVFTPALLAGRDARGVGTTVRANEEDLVHMRLLNVEEVDMARHIEKAQVLLRSFRNARLEEGEAAGDISYEKRLSRQLLNENLLLRSESEASNDLPSRQLLSTLEPLLLDIANLNDKPSKQDVRSIKERMRKMDIIAALEVYD